MRILSLFCVFIGLSALNPSEATAQKTLFGIPHTNVIHKDNLRQFYFLDAGALVFSEYYFSKADVVYTQTKPYHTNELLENGVNYHASLGVIGARLNQRLNLIEYNDWVSLSLVVPVQLCLTSSTSPNLSVFVPVFLQTNFFRQSTKTVLDEYGFHVGMGYGTVRQFSLGLAGPDDKGKDKASFALMNMGLTFPAKWWDGLRRLDYWIGLNPRMVTDGADRRLPTNFYFSVSLTSGFFI